MSNNIEDNIVSMKFDNKQFESGVATSLGTMDKLKSSLAFPDAGKGLADVNKAAQGFNLNPMANSIQGVSKMWLGLTTVAITAISNITNKVVDSGIQLAKSFTIDPITQGFQEYEKNLNSTQTIMANTGKSVKIVGQYLGDLNHYSDQTIYNFGQMADSIGKFTAAGVNLPNATDAIKGMANSAALSGSSVDQLNTAMYQMSQALSTGTIRLMDWNSLANAGMGGKNIREALMATNKTLGDHGAAMEAAIQDQGSFRDSLQAGWLNAETFTKTMKVMAGQTNKAGKTVAFSVKQLQGMGYSLQAAKDLNKLSSAAIDSATKVKTFTQMIDVVKESIGSGWSKIFQDLFGNFKEATKLWTGVTNTITGGVGKVFGSIDKMLVGWRKLGGFEDLWATVGNIFKILGNLIHPVISLFQMLLPSTGKAGSGLAKFTSFLATFTGWLVKLTSPMGDMNVRFTTFGLLINKLKVPITGLIKAMAPLLDIFKKLGSVIGDQFNQGASIAGNLIDGWIYGLDAQQLEKAAVDLANSWITWIKDALGIHSPASTMVPIGVNIIQGIAEGLTSAAQGLIKVMQKIFIGLGQAMKWAVENISYSDVLDTINSGLFLGLVLMFKRFVDTFGNLTNNLSAVFGSASGVLDQFKNNLKSMQNEIRAKALMNIAIAVAVLAGSAVLLASVDTKKLTTALAAIGGLMVTLVGSMRLLTAGGGKKMPDAKTMAKQTGQIVALSGAMVAFSTAVLILSGAVAIMGKLDPKTMQQGLEGVGAIVAGIVAATAILGKTGGGGTILATATALLILSAALTAFVGVMKLYESLDISTITNGGGKAALVILAIGAAMQIFQGKRAISGAIGMVIISEALKVITDALILLSSIDGKKLLAMVLMLDILMVSMAGLAEVSNPASAAGFIIMAAAIFILAKSLDILAKIPGGDIFKGMVAIVAAILLIAGTAAALSSLSPLILALGVALLSVGGALFLAGAGVFMFAAAMGILAVVGPAAFQALVDGADQLLAFLPKLGEAMGEMVVSFFTGLVKAAGPLTKAIGKLLEILLQALTNVLPKVGALIQKLVRVILNTIVANQVAAAKAMIKFIVGMLRAMSNGIPKMIKAGTDLIIGVIKGLSKNAVKIADATGKAILDFLHGIHKAILKYEQPIIEEGKAIAVDLVKGLVKGLISPDALSDIGNAAKGLADKAKDALGKAWKILSPSKVTQELGGYFSEGAAVGINAKAHMAEKSAQDLADKSLEALKMTFKNSRNASSDLMDLQPKVTPVLDLTQLEKDATQISAKMGRHSVKADLSRRQARDIAAEHMARHGSGGPDSGGDSYEFVQNIYSPKPVNHVKAYRGTKSQIALFKEVKGK